jgi:hypothetical protein
MGPASKRIVNTIKAVSGVGIQGRPKKHYDHLPNTKQPKSEVGTTVQRSTTPLTDALRRKLDETAPNDPLHRTYAELIARKLILMALLGNLAAIKEIFDRIDGRVPYGAEKREDTPPRITIISHIPRPERARVHGESEAVPSDSLSGLEGSAKELEHEGSREEQITKRTA